MLAVQTRVSPEGYACAGGTQQAVQHFGKLHGYTVHQTMLKTFSLPTDAHNVKKHRVIKTF